MVALTRIAATFTTIIALAHAAPSWNPDTCGKYVAELARWKKPECSGKGIAEKITNDIRRCTFLAVMGPLLKPPSLP